MTSYGVVNCSSIDSITLHHEAMREIAEQKRMGIEDPIREVLGSGIQKDQKLLNK